MLNLQIKIACKKAKFSNLDLAAFTYIYVHTVNLYNSLMDTSNKCLLSEDIYKDKSFF